MTLPVPLTPPEAAPAPKQTAPMFLWRQTIKSGRPRLVGAVGLHLVAGLIGITLAFSLAQILASLWQQQSVSLDQLEYLTLFLGLAMLRAVLGAGADILLARSAAALRVALRHRLYEVIRENGPLGLADKTTGSLLTTMMEKVEATSGYITRYLPQMVLAVTLPFVIAAIGFCISWKVAAVWLVAYAFLPLLLAISGILAGKANKSQMRSLTRLGHLFYDRLRHLPTLKAFGALARETAHLQQTADDFRTRTMRVLRLAFLSSLSVDLMALGAFVLTALLVFRGQQPLATALFLLLLVPEFFAPMRGILAAYHDRSTALAAIEDIRSLLTPKAKGPEGHRPLPSPLRHPSLDLQGLTYTYPSRSTPVLKNFSLRVEGTEFLALTGPSGCGKTTVLNLLLGFIHPSAGTIFLAGQPLHLIDPAERGSAFALVSQNSYLFHGTLGDNIRLGRMNAHDHEVIQALESAQLGAWLKTLPEGLNTRIGEGGYGLSGGQAQRVALARAFLRDTAVLLLDEPTAGLDSATATALMQTITKLAQGRTVLMVSHDPLALSFAEKIVQMEAVHA